jgi:predicted SnoaL-like aldol condensation-catalyzing enzyme
MKLYLKLSYLLGGALCGAIVSTLLVAQTPVVGAPSAEALTKSPDKRLEANKTLILNLFREVFEARRADAVDKFLAVDMIQHNPNFTNGNEQLKRNAGKNPPLPINNPIHRKFVTIMAEGDMVLAAFPRELPDPDDASKTYTTVQFDLYRIQNGKVAEHWDNAVKTSRSSKKGE